MKTDNNVQLLKCKLKAASHGGMSGRDNSITELAEEYSFILKNAGIKKLNSKSWNFKNHSQINNSECHCGLA